VPFGSCFERGSVGERSFALSTRAGELPRIERFHSHLCRHTFATEWREAGGSLAALQAVLGHGTIAVTERYGTIGDDLVEREAQRLVQHRAQGGVR
jgi:integrase